jgi:hypothetical protein
MHSSKCRFVTVTTVGGGQDWQPLFGMTLCDLCYSTYRKHGTFIRSVRTPEGWARFDHSAQKHVLDEPSKKLVAHASGPAKRAHPAPSVEQGVQPSVESRLLQLKDLLAKGFVSEEEYNTRRETISDTLEIDLQS